MSGFASTPYNVAVGGTDFGDSFAGTNSTYWNSTNTATFGSARSYIPEIPWNDSCAGALLSSFEGFATPYGSTGFCNSTTGANFRTTGSGSGGPSGCATGLASWRYCGRQLRGLGEAFLAEFGGRCLRTACGICPTFRSFRPTDFGDTTTYFAGRILLMAGQLALGRRVDGRERAELRLLRRLSRDFRL